MRRRVQRGPREHGENREKTRTEWVGTRTDTRQGRKRREQREDKATIGQEKNRVGLEGNKEERRDNS
jgi:hypothetical protein